MPHNKGKKVTITMKSVSDPVGETPDIIELITEGTLRELKEGGANGWEISYNDSEATGFEGAVTTVSCIGEELASMTRSGAYETKLIIEKDRRHHCSYGTQFGQFLMGISATRIINRMTENGGELYFKYTIDVNSALISENEVYMSVKLAE